MTKRKKKPPPRPAELVTVVESSEVVAVRDEMTSNEILEVALSKLSKTTRALYRGDWERFMRWYETKYPGDPLRNFLALPIARAAQACNLYIDSLVEANRAPATRKRAQTAIRKMVRIWYLAGVAQWDIPPELLLVVKVRQYKDVEGISAEDFNALLAAVRLKVWAEDPPRYRRGSVIDLDKPPEGLVAKSIRDEVILLLLHDSALRRREVATLELVHYNEKGEWLEVWQKGLAEGDRVRVPITKRTKAALQRWLEARGSEDGPLFTRLSPAGGLQTINGDTVEYVTIFWSGKAGLQQVFPHQLRHTAITRAAQRGASAQALMHFARHTDFTTTQVYIDSVARDVRGTCELVAGDGEEE